MQNNQQNTGGKAKTAGRGGQNNYKPYWFFKVPYETSSLNISEITEMLKQF